MWLWRDWVIRLTTEIFPLDEFTIQQLAGDLLPNPTTEDKIASGFNRYCALTRSSARTPRSSSSAYTVDRTATLGQVWLGLTLGSAVPFAQKYDPISQQEFYQLYAFFTGIKEPMVSGNTTSPCRLAARDAQARTPEGNWPM